MKSRLNLGIGLHMQNIIIAIHLILTLLLIGAILVQRSEGGALGMGGGGSVMSGRGAATALQKATWGLTVVFIVTSIILTLLATQQARDTGVMGGNATIETPATDEAPATSDGFTPTTEDFRAPTLDDGTAENLSVPALEMDAAPENASGENTSGAARDASATDGGELPPPGLDNNPLPLPSLGGGN